MKYNDKFAMSHYLISYGVFRFIIEFVKINQVEFEQGMWLNMGQWLSIPFIIVGAAFVWYALKHPAVDDDKKVKSNKK